MTDGNVVSQSYVGEVARPDRPRDRGSEANTLKQNSENGMSRICYHLGVVEPISKVRIPMQSENRI